MAGKTLYDKLWEDHVVRQDDDATHDRSHGEEQEELYSARGAVRPAIAGRQVHIVTRPVLLFEFLWQHTYDQNQTEQWSY